MLFFTVGERARGIIETCLVTAVFAFPPLMAASSEGLDAFLTYERHISNIGFLVPQTLLLLYIIDSTGASKQFFSSSFGISDLKFAFIGAFSAILMSFTLSYALHTAGLAEAIQVRALAPLKAWLFIPLLLLSTVAIGAREELLYRVYIPKRLELSGIPYTSGSLLSITLFTAAHTYQGIQGIIVSAALASLFSFIFMKSRSFYAIALSHAIYDFVVIARFFFAMHR